MNPSQQFLRYEFKYPMPDYAARGILEELHYYGMEADPNLPPEQNGVTTVNSLYFDSPFLDDYQDKAGGFIDRKKIRVRIYEPLLTPSTKIMWLEKKAKHDMRVSKRRVPISFEVYQDIIYGSRLKLYARCKDLPHGPEIAAHVIQEHMRPQAIVRYQRIPLVSRRDSGFRITLDSNIEACRANDLCYTRPMTRVYSGTTVMEVKFSTMLPWWVKTLVQKHQLRRASFSKYANAMEVLHTYNPIPR